MVLQGIFSCAVNWGHVQSNPVVGVRKPSAKRQRAVTPPSPALVERMRGELLAAGQLRDATLVSILAYAGLRPQEALGLPWSNVRGRTLLVDRAQSDEGLKDTKTGGTRSVRLLAPLVADLAAWRLARGPLIGKALVIPTRDGELWRDHDWANWRRRVFDPLAANAECPECVRTTCGTRSVRCYRRGHVGRRGRAPGRARIDDDARDLRTCDRGPRRRRAGVR
jgi:integrase